MRFFMVTKNEILRLLIAQPHEFISGQQIADTLNISRNAVWKAIRSLKKDGYLIDSKTNKGYRLSEQNDILSETLIKSKLCSDKTVICYPSIDSTNTQAKRLINEGREEDLLLVADEQTNGRGRQGKHFYSPALTGIYMTYVFHPHSSLGNTVGVTTAAAVAVCRAIESLTDKKPQIKWVNDVCLDGKKICGILTEAISDFETQTVTSVIIGIGMNIKTVHFPKEVENAGNLSVDIRRADLIAQITNELDAVFTNKADYISYYRTHSMILGKHIQFIKNGIVTPATAIAIDENGGLEVRTDDGREITLTSGEISIRKG